MMTPADEYRILLKQIRRLSRALDVQSRRIDRDTGLTVPQLVVLTAIGDLGEVTGRAIAARADISPATVVGILDKLESKALIERYRSASDRRIVHARLTQRGRDALEAAPDPLGDRLRLGFGALSEADRRATLTALERLGALVADAGDVDQPGFPAAAH